MANWGILDAMAELADMGGDDFRNRHQRIVLPQSPFAPATLTEAATALPQPKSVRPVTPMPKLAPWSAGPVGGADPPNPPQRSVEPAERPAQSRESDLPPQSPSPMTDPKVVNDMIRQVTSQAMTPSVSATPAPKQQPPAPAPQASAPAPQASASVRDAPSQPSAAASSDPIRDEILWHIENPTATRSGPGGPVVYRGNMDGLGPTDRAAIGQRAFTDQLMLYDENQAKIRAQQAQAGFADANAASVPAQSAADTARASAATQEAETRAAEQTMKEKLLGVSAGAGLGIGQIPPGQQVAPAQAAAMLMADTAHGGSAIHGIINDAVTNNGYVSDLMTKLTQIGAFQDPQMAPIVASTLRYYMGPQIDEIMNGGREGMISKAAGLIPSVTGILGAPGEALGMGSGARALADMLDPHNQSLSKTRESIERLYPDLYRTKKESVPAAKPAPQQKPKAKQVNSFLADALGSFSI